MVCHAVRTEEKLEISAFLSTYPASLIDAEVHAGFICVRMLIFVRPCLNQASACARLCACIHLSCYTVSVCERVPHVCAFTVLFLCTMPVGMWRPSQPCQGQLRRGWQPGKMMMMKLKFCARQKGLPRFHWRLCASICSSI